MAVTREEVEKIAALARLHLSANELHEMTSDLNEIIAFVDKLAELEAGHAPASLGLEDGPTPKRPDVSWDFTASGEILSSACLPMSGYFSVPKVIEENESSGSS